MSEVVGVVASVFTVFEYRRPVQMRELLEDLALVSDTGTGMKQDVIAKAFDPVFTIRLPGQGTGLVLSMIYGFARQSGGQVRICSEFGQGSMIYVYLPRIVGAEAVSETVPELAEAPRARDRETVLIVDDEPTVRMMATEVLPDIGYAAIET